MNLRTENSARLLRELARIFNHPHVNAVSMTGRQVGEALNLFAVDIESEVRIRRLHETVPPTEGDTKRTCRHEWSEWRRGAFGSVKIRECEKCGVLQTRPPA
jgi:hypothetical protein